MLVIGAFLAGIFLILKELVPLVGAWRSGAIMTWGHRPVRVTRAQEPDRFKGLCRQRFKDMRFGALAIAVGFAIILRPYVVELLALPFRMVP
ncbi:hypothetical protein [Brevundimonas sp.]|uniref:hypothetical protein n=1 Tax=Brevundimonas sp. TaxID=1871086 RepID=UPI002AB9B025|nr:hypothetical protein [Brevundimonas sp.]MDZ4362023.1 hypothetical protein [Brevundimonas sp.]